MNRFLLMIALVAGVALATAPGQVAAAPDTVTICHATGNDSFVTLTIPRNAAFGQAGHFNENGTTKDGHEDDYLGPCRPVDTTTTTTSTTTSTTSTTSTSTTSTTVPNSSTTTSIVVDTCEDLGTCPDEGTTTTTEPGDTTTTVPGDTTTTEPVTSSTIAIGGSAETIGFSLAGLVSLILGAGSLLVSRRA